MITILLATYNGEKYLKEQLDSLLNQTYKNFHIIARDDLSNDRTLDILKSYNITILPSTENIGAKLSFNTLLEYALKNTNSNYFMFCDQDDIWEKNKIKISIQYINKLEKDHQNTPLLVHTDLKIVDENLNSLHNSFMKHQNLNAKYNTLNRLLMQNIITGCTTIINKELAILSLPIHDKSVMHDWWIGLVASKFGYIGYIDKATIMYRQHSNNNIGATGVNINTLITNNKINPTDKIIQQAQEFLHQYKNKLDTNDINMLEQFSNIKSNKTMKKFQIIIKYKLFKQGLIRNIGLFLKI